MGSIGNTHDLRSLALLDRRVPDRGLHPRNLCRRAGMATVAQSSLRSDYGEGRRVGVVVLGARSPRVGAGVVGVELRNPRALGRARSGCQMPTSARLRLSHVSPGRGLSVGLANPMLAIVLK